MTAGGANRGGVPVIRRVAPSRVRPPALQPAAALRRFALPPLDSVAHLLVIAGALTLWGVALGETHLSRISGFGLLSALPVTYYGALVVLSLGFTLALAGRPLRVGLLVAYVAALVVVLHATTAVLYQEPRYVWTYKHLGVIGYIAGHGSVDRSIDVYQNWPGFFALMAWLTRALGVAPIDYAGWAQVAFGLLNVAVVAFALRGLTRDPRLLGTAVWLFVVGNWVGQDYLSPQAFSFVLGTALLGLIVHYAPPGRPPAVGRWLAARAGGSRRPDPASHPPVGGPDLDASLGPRAALVLGAGCYLGVVVSHQLTPVILLLSVAALWLVTGRPPVWVIVAMAAVEAGWVYLSWDFVHAHFNLLQFDLTTSARESAPGAQPLPGATLGLDASRGAIIVVVLLALAGAVAMLRSRRRPELAPIVLAGAPAVVVLVQSYGGEAPLRAYLFALPWLAFLAARVLRRPPAVLVASVVVGAGSLFGYFGQEMLNLVGPGSVAASRWYLDHSPPGSSLTEIAPGFPERLNARYARRLDVPPSLMTRPGFHPHRLGAADVPALRRLLEGDNARARYVVLDPVGARYAAFYGLAPRGSFRRLAVALERSPDFRLVFHRRLVWLFRYAP